MKHNTEVLLSINAKYWEIKEGKYSIEDLDLYPNNEKFYQVSYNPLAFAYCATQDTEILHNSRLLTEVKVGLVKHLANVFHSMLTWQSDQRGRKIGIEADLTNGGIVSGEKNFTLNIEYFRRYTDSKGEHLEAFIIQFKGNIEGRMPYEHMVTIDTAGNAYLGYCLSIVPTNIPNDMNGIFKLVY